MLLINSEKAITNPPIIAPTGLPTPPTIAAEKIGKTKCRYVNGL